MMCPLSIEILNVNIFRHNVVIYLVYLDEVVNSINIIVS